MSPRRIHRDTPRRLSRQRFPCGPGATRSSFGPTRSPAPVLHPQISEDPPPGSHWAPRLALPYGDAPGPSGSVGCHGSSQPKVPGRSGCVMDRRSGGVGGSEPFPPLATRPRPPRTHLSSLILQLLGGDGGPPTPDGGTVRRHDVSVCRLRDWKGRSGVRCRRGLDALG